MNSLCSLVIVCCTLGLVYGNLNPKHYFPEDFLFGSATSAYQIEGAWNYNGKVESNWDYYTHNRPNMIFDRSNGDIASDSYHRFKEDVTLLKELGVHFYRFSLSWTRILPSPLSTKVNPDGIRYYNELIDELLQNNIEPMVTLFHWDLPQYLEKIGGFTNSLIIESFANFANIAFKHFGDRVKKWSTFNEPGLFCMLAYGGGILFPAYNLSGIADYLCVYHVLKAHAEAYHLYNNTYKAAQQGGVSINFDSRWSEPATSRNKDVEAAERAMEFKLGILAHPILNPRGDYPDIVKNIIAERSEREGYFESRLPQLNQKEVEYIKGTLDFFCLNHYTTKMTKDKEPEPIGTPSFEKDVNIYDYDDPSWPLTIASKGVVPWGLKKLLVWIKERYDDPEIYITENGFADYGQRNDTGRINYYHLYLSEVLEAIHKYKVRVKGYAAWSLIDNFEWNYGYTVRFGLYHVDFSNPSRQRSVKASADYYKRVIYTRKP